MILLTGRFAGKKAVIVKNYDDGSSGRAYGHALVCGLSKEPRKVSLKLWAAKFSILFLQIALLRLLSESALRNLRLVWTSSLLFLSLL